MIEFFPEIRQLKVNNANGSKLNTATAGVAAASAAAALATVAALPLNYTSSHNNHGMGPNHSGQQSSSATAAGGGGGGSATSGTSSHPKEHYHQPPQQSPYHHHHSTHGSTGSNFVLNPKLTAMTFDGGSSFYNDDFVFSCP